MAITSRAPRFANSKKSKKLGPGSYNVTTSAPSKSSSNAGAFSSTAPRGLLHYEIDEYQSEPGQYYQAQINEVALSAHSNFKSNSHRFMTNNHPKTPIPGPAAYNVTNDTIQQQMPQKNECKQRLNIIKSAEINGSMTKNPPSIPYGDTAFGYETTTDGRLIPRTPPILKRNTEHNENENENESASVAVSKWSKSKTKRFEESDPIKCTLNELIRDRPQTTKKIMSLATLQKLQRFYAAECEQQIIKNKEQTIKKKEVCRPFISKSKRFETCKDEIPGPAHYNVLKEAPQQKSKKVIIHSTVSSRAQTAAQRHNYKSHQQLIEADEECVDDRPGPGSYNIRSTFESIEDVNATNIQLGLPPKAPFLSTVCKFNEDHSETKKMTPGPGYYSSSILNAPLMNKPRIKYHKAPFGQHGERKCNETTNQNVVIGPGQYDVSMASYLMAPNKLKFGATAAFKSGTKRLSDDKKKKFVPGPGAYNLDKGIGANEKNADIPHNVYRFATKKERPFISNSERFSSAMIKNKIPGVGTYTIAEEEVKSSKAPFGSTKNRFVGNCGSNNDYPGPNTYEVVKKDSLIKKSFNCTFD